MKGKITAALAIAILIGTMFSVYESDSSTKILFEEWKENLGIEFSAQEEIYRMRIFADNVAKINQHNEKGEKTHK